MPMLDVPLLARLQEEFRLSMKRLLGDLCLDLESQYADVAKSLALPVAYFRFLGQALERDAYAHWKVVGWIEALNDLVYFIDLLQQIREEQNPRDFAAQLYAECEEKFFENSYLDDLFPRGISQASGLERRLNELCARLTQELTQESLCLVPGLSMLWCASRKIPSWTVEAQLGGNIERAEMFGTMTDGMEGDIYEASLSVKRSLKQSSGQAAILVQPHELSLKIGRTVTPLCMRRGNRLEWSWTPRSPVVAIEIQSKAITVGPTLVYGRDRQPRTVVSTPVGQVKRITQAWTTVQDAWPQGHELLALLTTRIIPLKAKGVVSFSYRHRPGLSFINCFDRDNLDLIDDVIHENSHHHLNLLLRKQILYRGDRNQQIFYSPWRRSLRPLRGILHATFTFTMGAMLFERLSTWASGRGGSARWKQAGLTSRDLQRARFRCLEEVESVRYSIQDLEYADWHLKWLTGSGQRLVKQLAEAINQVEQNIAPHRKAVLASKFGPSLRRHMKELHQARQTYGPVRLSKA
ncbi:MAG TPA: HEXXH motif-containing putative peptide modification protein [Nitrospiraceae bacterium]|nr:HEXXH motif-containing putative peptide modification protein [Nitrospiraceae bacterium]